MAQSAKERRAAQRRTAAIVRANRERPRGEQIRIVNTNVRQAVWNARVNWANDVMSGREPMPAPGTMEAKNLASLASYSAHGQADPRFEAAFSRYWYHFKDAQQPEEYVESEEIDEDGDDEDSDGE